MPWQQGRFVCGRNLARTRHLQAVSPLKLRLLPLKGVQLLALQRGPLLEDVLRLRVSSLEQPLDDVLLVVKFAVFDHALDLCRHVLELMAVNHEAAEDGKGRHLPFIKVFLIEQVFLLLR
jgi:hypothetical protein